MSAALRPQGVVVATLPQGVKENDKQATMLGIEAGEPMIGLLRQRPVAGSPVIADIALVPHHRCLALAAVKTR